MDRTNCHILSNGNARSDPEEVIHPARLEDEGHLLRLGISLFKKSVSASTEMYFMWRKAAEPRSRGRRPLSGSRGRRTAWVRLDRRMQRGRASPRSALPPAHGRHLPLTFSLGVASGLPGAGDRGPSTMKT